MPLNEMAYVWLSIRFLIIFKCFHFGNSCLFLAPLSLVAHRYAPLLHLSFVGSVVEVKTKTKNFSPLFRFFQNREKVLISTSYTLYFYFFCV